MKSKTIFACEGKNDSFFLECVLVKQLRYNKEKDLSFYSTEQKKNIGQKDAFSKFMSPYADIAKCFLIKNEGNKDGVESFLKNHVTATFLNRKSSEIRLRLVAVVDSDIGFKQKYDDSGYKEHAKKYLEKKIEKPLLNYTSNMTLHIDEPPLIFDEALIYSIEIEFKKGERSFEFHIILFKKTLEQLVKINKGKDSREEQEKKIYGYVQKSRFYKLFEKLALVQKNS